METSAAGSWAAGNQVVFERAGTNGAVTVEWYVAEFATGVTVQRGTADLTTGNALQSADRRR